MRSRNLALGSQVYNTVQWSEIFSEGAIIFLNSKYVFTILVKTRTSLYFPKKGKPKIPYPSYL